MVDGVVGCVELAEVEQLEAVLPQDREQLGGRRVEVGPGHVPLLPVGPVETLLGQQEPVGRRPLVGDAEDPERRAAHEDELASRSQQPRRLPNPERRVAPDRGAVLREDEVEGLVGERDVLGVRLDQLEPQAELLVHSPRRVELGGGEVDPDDTACPGPLEPGAEVGRAAAELDHLLPRDVGEDAELPLGQAPMSPHDLLPRPRLARRAVGVLGVGQRPRRTVARDVLGLRHHASLRATQISSAGHFRAHSAVT